MMTVSPNNTGGLLSPADQPPPAPFTDEGHPPESGAEGPGGSELGGLSPPSAVNDLDLRPTPPTRIPSLPSPETTAGGEREAYKAAFDLLKAGKYPEARAGFEAFLAAHPQHELASNAQYWLGEVSYVERNYDAALAAFREAEVAWHASGMQPQGRIATWSVARCLRSLQRYDEALFAKPRWLVLNKLDLVPEDEREARVAAFVKAMRYKGPVFAIAAISGEGCRYVGQTAFAVQGQIFLLPLILAGLWLIVNAVFLSR